MPTPRPAKKPIRERIKGLFSSERKTAFAFCQMCGRRLIGEKSRLQGVGPICLKKVNAQAALEAQGQMRLFDEEQK